MNWKLIGTLATFGVVMGAATVLGLTRNLEVYLWVAIEAFCGIVIAKDRPPKIFLHGLVVGLLVGALAPITEAVFIDLFLENNPQFRALGDLGPRLSILATAVPIAVMTGLVVGMFAWVAERLFRPADEPARP